MAIAPIPERRHRYPADRSSALPIVYVVDDHAPMRASIEALLDGDAQIFCFSSAEEFLAAMESLSPGVLLTDIRMGGMSGLELLDRIGDHRERFRPVIMTAHGDVEAAIKALRAGATDFLQKPFREKELLEIVRREAAKIAAPIAGESRLDEAKRALLTLSPREFEVVRLLTLGSSNKSIAHDLGLSVRTVEMHRARAMARLGCRSLAEVVALGLHGDIFNLKSETGGLD